MRALVLASLFAAAASGQLPEFYKQVDRILFVVPDMDRSLAAWKNSGVVETFETENTSFVADYRGRPSESSVRYAAGRFGDVIANWVQPVSGSNALADFLKQHGPGVFALMHRAPSMAELDAEVARLARHNVKVLQQGSMGGKDSRYVFFDTEAEGKYTLGVFYQPGDAPSLAGPKVTQFAFIIRDHEPVAKYWASLGWPRMSVTHPELHALEYRGKPGDFKAPLGWIRHGKVPYEWIIPVKGPSTWHDHLERHGEGVHHLAFNVEDMDRAVAEWKQRGFEPVMSGAWGEPGKRGYGRFAYVDAQDASGIDVELLWSFREK